MSTATGLTYAQAGVNIDAGNTFVDRIKPLARTTRRPGVLSDTDDGGFAGVIDLAQTGIEGAAGKAVFCNDGVGTKLLLALKTGLLNTVGIDCVAMCVNDLICKGATPIAFLDYYGVGRLDPDTGVQLVEGIVKGCRLAECWLAGGETAELPGIYEGDRFDLVGSAFGMIDSRHALSTVPIKPGDAVIGLTSSGIHSNGLSLVRKIIESAELDIHHSYDASHHDDRSLGEVLLTPTHIYVREVLTALGTGKVKGVAHITGGGLIDNPPRLLPKGSGLGINFDQLADFEKDTPWLFKQLQQWGNVSTAEMRRTFNCGIGMILVVDPADVDITLGIIRTRATSTGIREDRRIGWITAAGAEQVTFNA